MYDLPGSVLGGSFSGGANILTGKAVDASRIALAGGTLATTGRPLIAGEPTSVSVRQHEIEILPAKPADAGNVLAAVVSRQVFLGSSRDYTVALPDKTELRG